MYRDGDGDPQCLSNPGVSEDDNIARWIRERLPTLEQEISEGFVFSFSLAGLDKLSKSGRLPNQRDFQSISRLFGLPEDRVFTLNDGDAHLLASRTCLSITEFPQVNFCVGTGVGIGMYDDTGHLVPESQLTAKLGRNVWDFVTDSSASRKEAWFALANRGYEELAHQDPTKASGRFEERWLKFLEGQFFSALGRVPTTITLTGGIVDFGNLFRAARTLLECQIRRGPNQAGLLGARLHAEQAQL